MKIAFTGAYCTGKTTLFNTLKSLLANDQNYSFAEEVARKVIDRGFPLNKEATVDSYVYYINQQLISERLINSSTHYISDRSLIDPLAYALLNQELACSLVSDYFVEMMYNIWTLERKQFDLYVYFPIEFPIVMEQNTLLFDSEYRQGADIKILTLLDEHNLDYVIASGTVEERFSTVLKRIQRGTQYDRRN